MAGFIDLLAGESDARLLVAPFLAATQAFGLECCAAGAWTGMGQPRAYRFFFNSWPEDWLARYSERDVFDDDPLVMEARRRMTPFRWAELRTEGCLSAASLAVIAQAEAYGWADGLAVPVHGPAGYQGMVSFASRRPLDLSAADVLLVWTMALAMHASCRGTPGLGEGAPPPRLTPRESACMRWVAAGKTEWEVAALLGIKPTTVHFHVHRPGAPSRAGEPSC